MNSAAKHIREQVLQCDQLPVLPPGIPHLLQALSDEDIDNRGLGTAISHFPSIAGRLMSLANSAWAAPPIPVTSLDMACARLGLNTVRNVSIALAIASPFNPGRCPAFDAKRHWSTSLLVADGVTWLASTIQSSEDLDLQAMHTAGLLHNLGLLWLADKMPQETADALTLSTDQSISLGQAQQQLSGIDYCQVGGYLGESWSLPNCLVVAMREPCHHQYAGDDWHYPALVRTVSAMVSAIHRGEEQRPESSYIERLSIDPADQDALFEKLTDKFESTLEMTQTLFPG